MLAQYQVNPHFCIFKGLNSEFIGCIEIVARPKKRNLIEVLNTITLTNI